MIITILVTLVAVVVSGLLAESKTGRSWALQSLVFCGSSQACWRHSRLAWISDHVRRWHVDNVLLLPDVTADCSAGKCWITPGVDESCG
jgi:hypothetical protein